MTKIRVLCMGNDAAMLEFIKDFLEKYPDMSVETVGSYERVQSILAREKFDAIVADYALNDLRGNQVIKALRDKGDQTPFIALTERGSDDVVAEALNAGADFYLQKGMEATAQFALLSNIIRQIVLQRTADVQLHETYQRLEAIIESSPLPIVAIDPEGKVNLWNEGAERVFGWKAEEVVGKSLPFVPPEAREEFKALRERTLGGEAISGLELRRMRKDGTPIDILLSTAPVRDHSGSITGIMAAIVDITEHRLMDEKLRRLNRLYAMLSQTNAAIARFKDREKLFDEICRIAVEEGSFKIAWIGALDSKTGEVKVVAARGVPADFLRGFRITAHDEPNGRGPTGKSIRTGKLVLTGDITKDPDMAQWRDAAIRLGVRSAAAIPVRIGGKVFGTLSIYATEVDFFQEDEKRLLEEVAADVSFALDTMKNEETRRKVQQALKREAEMTQRVFETAGAVLVVLDRDGRIVRFNKEAEKVTGFTSDEMLGKSIWDTLIPPEVRDEVRAVFANLKAGNYPSRHENEWLTKSGPKRLIAWRNSALVNPDGVVEFVIGTGIDVTEIRKAQDDLRRSEAQLRLITENQLDMVTQIDANGKYLYASASHKSVVGYTPEELIGKPIFDYIHPDDVDGVLELIVQAVEGGSYHGIKELRFRRADGSYVWVEAVGTGVNDEKGNLIGGVFATRDISQRKVAEEGLVRRTEEAEAAKARAQTYLDFMSHDIMNIITPMTSYSQLMLENEKNPPDTKKQAEKVDLQLKRLSSFVRNVRRLSHAEVGVAKGFETVDLRDILSRAESEAHARSPRKRLTVNYSLPEGPLLSTGKGFVDDVINEIFSNAVQHTPAEEVVIDVVVKPGAQEGRESSWHIEIADHGPGIPDERKRLLVPDSIEGAATMTRGVATTLTFLGLMVERLGGRMRIEDRVAGDHGQGTKVVMRLPRGPVP